MQLHSHDIAVMRFWDRGAEPSWFRACSLHHIKASWAKQHCTRVRIGTNVGTLWSCLQLPLLIVPSHAGTVSSGGAKPYVLRAGMVSSGSSRLGKNYISLKYNYTVATELVPVPKYKTLKEPVPEPRNKRLYGTIEFHEANNGQSQ